MMLLKLCGDHFKWFIKLESSTNGVDSLAEFACYTAKKDLGAFLNLFKELGAFNLLRKEPKKIRKSFLKKFRLIPDFFPIFFWDEIRPRKAQKQCLGVFPMLKQVKL
jgi:hypothetical protein